MKAVCVRVRIQSRAIKITASASKINRLKTSMTKFSRLSTAVSRNCPHCCMADVCVVCSGVEVDFLKSRSSCLFSTNQIKGDVIDFWGKPHFNVNYIECLFLKT